MTRHYGNLLAFVFIPRAFKTQPHLYVAFVMWQQVVETLGRMIMVNERHYDNTLIIFPLTIANITITFVQIQNLRYFLLRSLFQSDLFSFRNEEYGNLAIFNAKLLGSFKRVFGKDTGTVKIV